MGRLCWLVLGLLACSCGGRVVGMIGSDAGSSPPPQRGPVDGSVIVVDTGPSDLIVTAPCTVANNNCPDGFYCQSANCVTGVCTAAPASTDENPVCGCDRLTYWNTSLAAANGASVRGSGACPNAMSTACSANNPNSCPMPALCNLEQPTVAGCNLVNAGGRCWVLPDTCPPLAAGTATTRRCNSNNACQSRCTLITNMRTFFVDPTCP